MTDTQSLIERLLENEWFGENMTDILTQHDNDRRKAATELQRLTDERDALLVDNGRLRDALRHIAYNYDVSSFHSDPANNPMFIARAALEAALTHKP